MGENTSRLEQTVAVLRNSLPLFAELCLKIRTKKMELKPFKLNPVQQVLHDAIEDQKRRTGRVRMLVPKSRRAGISTYIGARFYHQTSLNRLRKTLIFTHHATSSDELYEMVERMQANNPFAPHTGTSNTKELEFDFLDSKYTVATAGSTDFGRGLGFSLFHGSEVAFWPQADKHFAGVVETVPDEDNTEVVLESTGYGPTGKFYKLCMDALAGIGDYEICFLPWMLDPDNNRTPKPGFVLSEEKAEGDDMSEAEYARLFNLTPTQACWMHFKRIKLGSAQRFHREFPATVHHVFSSTDANAYHDAANVMRARRNPDKKGEGPLIMGVDPAGEGGDRFAIAFRRGHSVEEVLSRHKVDSEEGVAWVTSLIDERKPDVVFIDAGGIGRPIISRLRGIHDKYARIIRAVNFGAKSFSKMANPKRAGPKNRRAEMQERVKLWLESPEGVSIPDSDDLQADALSIRTKPDPNNDLVLLSKPEMRALGYRSPDLWDSVGLTFAETFYKPDIRNHTNGITGQPVGGTSGGSSSGGSWMSG